MAVRVMYSELRLNHQSGSIVKGVLRDWSKRIHNVNKVPRPNLPQCTYCHQIRHQINECPFIEHNVTQRFVENFQNLNLELVRAKKRWTC
jgi:hypothetical protein